MYFDVDGIVQEENSKSFLTFKNVLFSCSRTDNQSETLLEVPVRQNGSEKNDWTWMGRAGVCHQTDRGVWNEHIVLHNRKTSYEQGLCIKLASTMSIGSILLPGKMLDQ